MPVSDAFDHDATVRPENAQFADLNGGRRLGKQSACERKVSLGGDRSQTTGRTDMDELRAVLTG
jgi:hypothetical protein